VRFRSPGLLAGLALGLVLAACSGSAPATSTRPPDAGLTIYAAASLKGALEEARTAFESANPGTTLTISTDSSAALETQIEQGAPADVFLSADTANPAKLVAAGLAEGDPVTFAGSELAIVVPAANPARITAPADLARPGVKIIAAGNKVPLTAYATTLVQNLAASAGAPAGFTDGYAANIVSREDNAKAVLAKVGLGEGDAGIVYATDAKGSSGVTRIDVPAGANVLTKYDAVVVKSSRNITAARAFLGWLAGPGGQAILGRLGFLPPPS